MEQVTPKYFILPRSVTVIIGQNSYHISSDNIRYHEALKAIDEGKLDDLVSIVDPTVRLGTEGFSVVDGLVKYRDELLPSVLGDQFLRYKVEAVSFLSLVNFWMNLKHRVDFEKAKEKVVQMLGMNAYPLTKDGFIIVYRGEDHNWYNRPINGDVEIPFYSYASCRSSTKTQLEERKTFEEICLNEFGFFSKKLNKLVLDHCLDKKNLKFSDDVFKYAIIFKDIFSQENLVNFIEKKTFQDVFLRLSEGECQNLRTLLKNFTEKKIINFFTKFKDADEEKAVKNSVGQAGLAYLTLKRNNINIEMHRFQSFSELFTYMQREIYKLNHPLFDLNISTHFPMVNNILDKNINEELSLVIPETSHDLTVWSNEMSNCIGGYAKSVSSGGTLVLGVFNKKENKLIYNIEINNFAIRQFVRSRNQSVTEQERSPVKTFLKKFGLIK